MANYRVLKQVQLGVAHTPTRKTLHSSGGAEIPIPRALQIVKYAGDPGYYLLYMDEHGHELTDTYHESMVAALAQAKWEFNVQADEWQTVDETKPA